MWLELKRQELPKLPGWDLQKPSKLVYKSVNYVAKLTNICCRSLVSFLLSHSVSLPKDLK